MGSLVTLTVFLGIGVLVWLDFMRAREAAEREARRYCNNAGFQLLDDTVQLGRIGLRRIDGRPVVCRIYGFEFSVSGISRQSGYVALAGGRMLEVDRVPGAAH
ncbi:MAG: DUF3301 domain-containing protein [Gammaproteobacteria bacterium]|jgi:hypothetical protein|nr:DUF3301 domain-containing protein [Gammaproteobacteria bacterium]